LNVTSVLFKKAPNDELDFVADSALDITATDGLAKLIRMLASDKDGEVTAAVKAMKRTLTDRGMDFHALADLVANGSGGKAALADAYKNGLRDGIKAARECGVADGGGVDDEIAAWCELAKACLSRRRRLSEKEITFVEQMVRWTSLGRTPSYKQGTWLNSLYQRCKTREKKGNKNGYQA
jgi:hypothetical protein